MRNGDMKAEDNARAMLVAGSGQEAHVWGNTRHAEWLTYTRQR
jgi:hypothetical protein